MSDVQKAGKSPTRRSTRSPDTDGKATIARVRAQFQVQEELVQRLGVHCAMTGESSSLVVESILLSWLAANGRGRELFPPIGPESAEG